MATSPKCKKATGHVQSLSNIHSRIWRLLLASVGMMVDTRKRNAENGEPILKPMLTLYDLRHFSASVLIRVRKLTVKQVEKLMGHERAQMTLDIYGHLRDDPEADRETAKAIGKALSG